MKLHTAPLLAGAFLLLVCSVFTKPNDGSASFLAASVVLAAIGMANTGDKK